MRLQLAKWGNSLAVRLPAECVRATGLRQGDSADAEITLAGTITLTSAKAFDKAAFLQRLRKLHRGMPVTESVVELARAKHTGICTAGTGRMAEYGDGAALRASLRGTSRAVRRTLKPA